MTKIKTFDYDKAGRVHNFKYDYSLVKYTRCMDKIQIICPEHGVFEQTPNCHISRKCGCPTCHQKQVVIPFDYDKANKIHNFKYDYSLVECKGQNIKVKIICPTHGIFEQTPLNHIYHGSECLKCARILKNKLRWQNQDFNFEKARQIHNNRYDYSLVEYKKSNTKVKIICPDHGVFEQLPVNHISQKTGCPKCIATSSSKAEAKWLDSLNIDFLIRQYTIKLNKRPYKVDGFDPSTNTVYEYLGTFWHGNPYTRKTYGEHYLHTIDRIRSIEDAGFKVVYIWGT